VQKVARERAPTSIDRIADYGVAEVLKMHPYLVRATRLGMALHKGLSALRGQHAIGGQGGSTSLDHGHFLTVYRMPPDRAINRAMRHSRNTNDEGKVGFLGETACKLRSQGGVDGIGLRDHDASAGFFIQAMHDARTSGSPNPADRLAVV